jgi:hypothetical protein
MAEVYNPLADDDDLAGIPEQETPTENMAAGEGSPDDEDTPTERPETLTRAEEETWQAAFTKARQKDRQRYGKLQEEHGTYRNVLQQFYTDDAYALSVIRQRFPGISLPQGGNPGSPGTPQRGGSDLEASIQQDLGSELSFLAPALAKALQTAVRQAVAPFEQQTRAQQEAAKRQQQAALQAEMDQKYPGWDDRYGGEMQTLAEFLSSQELAHPKHGSKLELLYKLLNTDQAPIDATRRQQQAARSRQSVSRTGSTPQVNLRERIAKAPSDHDAFMLAARAAAEELGL